MGVGVTGWAFQASLEYFDFNRVSARAIRRRSCGWSTAAFRSACVLAAYARCRAATARRRRGRRSPRGPGRRWRCCARRSSRACRGSCSATRSSARSGSSKSPTSAACMRCRSWSRSRSVAVGELVRDGRPARSARGTQFAAAIAAGRGAARRGARVRRVARRAVRSTRRHGTSVRVAIVQGNVPNAFRWQREHMERTLATYVEPHRVDTRRQGPDLVVWPENAVDFYLEREPMLRGAAGCAPRRWHPAACWSGARGSSAATEARNSAQLLARRRRRSSRTTTSSISCRSPSRACSPTDRRRRRSRSTVPGRAPSR